MPWIVVNYSKAMVLRYGEEISMLLGVACTNNPQGRNQHLSVVGRGAVSHRLADEIVLQRKRGIRAILDGWVCETVANCDTWGQDTPVRCIRISGMYVMLRAMVAVIGK